MDREKMEADSMEKQEMLFLSCNNWEQLKVGVKMFNQLNILHDLPEKELKKLNNIIGSDED